MFCSVSSCQKCQKYNTTLALNLKWFSLEYFVPLWYSSDIISTTSPWDYSYFVNAGYEFYSSNSSVCFAPRIDRYHCSTLVSEAFFFIGNLQDIWRTLQSQTSYAIHSNKNSNTRKYNLSYADYLQWIVLNLGEGKGIKSDKTTAVIRFV